MFIVKFKLVNYVNALQKKSGNQIQKTWIFLGRKNMWEQVERLLGHEDRKSDGSTKFWKWKDTASAHSHLKKKRKERRSWKENSTRWFTRDLRLWYGKRTNTLISSSRGYQWWINTRSATTFQCFFCFPSSTWNSSENIRNRTGLATIAMTECVCVHMLTRFNRQSDRTPFFLSFFVHDKDHTLWIWHDLSTKVRKKRKNYNDQ